MTVKRKMNSTTQLVLDVCWYDRLYLICLALFHLQTFQILLRIITAYPTCSLFVVYLLLIDEKSLEIVQENGRSIRFVCVTAGWKREGTHIHTSILHQIAIIYTRGNGSSPQNEGAGFFLELVKNLRKNKPSMNERATKTRTCVW